MRRRCNLIDNRYLLFFSSFGLCAADDLAKVVNLRIHQLRLNFDKRNKINFFTALTFLYCNRPNEFQIGQLLILNRLVPLFVQEFAQVVKQMKNGEYIFYLQFLYLIIICHNFQSQVGIDQDFILRLERVVKMADGDGVAVLVVGILLIIEVSFLHSI